MIFKDEEKFDDILKGGKMTNHEIWQQLTVARLKYEGFVYSLEDAEGEIRKSLELGENYIDEITENQMKEAIKCIEYMKKFHKEILKEIDEAKEVCNRD